MFDKLRLRNRTSGDVHETSTEAEAPSNTQMLGDEKADREINVFEENLFSRAMKLEPPQPRKPIVLYMYLCCVVGFFNSTTNGFDENIGTKAGIINGMYQIGGVVALPFVGPAIDTWGRRRGMQIGSIIIVIGVIVAGTTYLNENLGQFLGGRFLAGFGVSISAAAGPIYVIELSHPAYRGILTGLYNVCWFTGSITVSIANRFCITLPGNQKWVVPLFLQMVAPGIVFLASFLIPESPRWLYTRSKFQQSKNMLIKFYGLGNPDSVWVQLQLNEYEQFLNLEGADRRWWDYRALFRNRTSIYRLSCTIVVSICCQWAGNGVVSYYLSGLLDTVGYTNSIVQLNFNIALSCIQFGFAVFGAFWVDTWGRRTMLVLAFFFLGFTWIPITIGSKMVVENPDNVAASKAALGFVFIFDIVYSILVTPLNALYPIEVLSFEMRAKGGAFSSLATSAVSMISQFAIPIALANIGWKLYIFFAVWCEIQSTILYFLIPETKGFTLEELDQIFEQKYPVKASKRAKELKDGLQHPNVAA